MWLSEQIIGKMDFQQSIKEKTTYLVKLYYLLTISITISYNLITKEKY